jgi:hypothetical protein
MAWADELTRYLRYSIGDYDDPQTYTDNRLCSMLVMAANFIIPQYDFTNTNVHSATFAGQQQYTYNTQGFTADAVAMTITPDPTILPYANEWFSNFIVFQAAIMISRNELRAATSNAFSFKEFHTSVDMKEIWKAKRELLKELQEVMEKLDMVYRVSVRPAGSAILSPFNVIAGGWRGPVYVFSDRDRFVI